MEIDKRNGNVNFNEQAHTYWNDNGDKYISVTTMIGQYGQPYDKDFWSKYKALEKLLGDRFSLEKSRLLKTKKWNDTILDTYDIKQADFDNEQSNILNEWDKKNKESCERGTNIHAQMEHKFYTGANSYSLKSYGIGGKFQCKQNYTKLDLEQGVYPEYLIYYDSPNGKLHVAGQIDLLIKDSNEISIIDYKTNSSIDTKSYYNTMTKKYDSMQYPLNTLMDCNFYHYALQLSTYAWMVNKLNPAFNIKKLMLIHFEHNGKVTPYDVTYYKAEVERMFKDYELKLKQKERAERRKPVEL